MKQDGIDREDDEMLSAFIDAELSPAQADCLLDRLARDERLRARWIELMHCRDAIADSRLVAPTMRDAYLGRAVMRQIDTDEAEQGTRPAPRLTGAPRLALVCLVLAALAGSAVLVYRLPAGQATGGAVVGSTVATPADRPATAMSTAGGAALPAPAIAPLPHTPTPSPLLLGDAAPR